MTRQLGYFLICSAIAHGAGLATWRSVEWFGAYSEAVLSVSLAAPELNAGIMRSEPQARTSVDTAMTPGHAKPAKRPDIPAPAIPSWATTAADPSADDSAVPVTQGDDADEYEKAHARIRSHLLSDLARHFHYPLLARQRGWEGTVLLGLRIESDGHLDKIRIERSSGYAVLDHSALNSLIRLGHLAEASSWLNGRDLDMQLPVIYRLVEN